MKDLKIPKLITLALLLLLCVTLLLSCDSGDGPSDTGETTAPPSEVTTGGDTTGGETDGETTPTGPALSFTENGALKYRIVRPEDPTEEEFEAANDLRDYLEELLSDKVSITVATDVLHVGEQHDPDTLEILIGTTNYKETAEVLSRTEYGDCTVEVVGNKIVIAGWDGVSTAKGVSKFRYLVRDEAKIGDPDNLNLPLSSLGFSLKVNKLLNGVPKIAEGTFRMAYDCGTNVYELIVKEVGRSAFDTYLDTLEAAGYTAYAENARGKVAFATYVNDAHILNVYYQEVYKDLRVIVEAYDEDVLPPKEATYEKICETEFAQVGLEYGGNQIGHCFIWKLEDGRFIVVDGGLDETVVYKALHTMAENPNKIVIAAWVLSHFHHDHTDAFEKFGAKYGTFVTLESVIWNSPSAAQYGYETNNCDASGYQPSLTSLSKFKVRPTVYKAHPGQVFYFANAKIEILYTVEMYAPANIGKGDLNTTSLVFDISFGKLNMIITNDMTEKANAIIRNNYGSTLEAEVGQVAHHGYAGGTYEFYSLVNPIYGLFTTGGVHYEACKGDYRNSYFATNTKRLRDVFVAKDDIYLFTLKDEGFGSCLLYENVDDFSKGITTDY